MKEITKRLPDYLKRPIIDTDKTKMVRHILKSKHLNTIFDYGKCLYKEL